MIVADIISYLEQLAPPDLAMPEDPIGLHVGDPQAAVSRIAVSVDPTLETIARAASVGAELLVCHHPLIYRRIDNVTSSSETGDRVLKAIQAGVAVYVMHTNYDCAPGGINDTLAEKIGLTNTRLLSVVSTEPYYKVVVFVPDEALESVRAAMCEAGGYVGNYSDCSFRTRGIGTFKPLEGAQPYLGETGKLEQADEWRLETLSPEKALPRVIQSMLRAHPYEEVAYDIYPLKNDPRKSGVGRVGTLEKPTTLAEFRQKVEDVLGCPRFTRITGDPNRTIRTVALCGGNGSSLISDAAKCGADVYLSGDLAHHTLLTAQWSGLATIDAGHFYTEKPGMVKLVEALASAYSGKGMQVEYVDR